MQNVRQGECAAAAKFSYTLKFCRAWLCSDLKQSFDVSLAYHIITLFTVNMDLVSVVI